MKTLIFFFIGFITINIYSQELVLVTGCVMYDSIPLENVIVKNISGNNYSVTNNKGVFNLNSKLGDSLIFSFLGMKDVVKVLETSDMLHSNLRIFMEENSIKLKEIIIDNSSNIDAVSLGIVPTKIKELSVNERRLKTAGDFKPIHLLSILGGQLEIDPILNSLNGRTKRLKKNIEVEKKEKLLNFIKSNYHDYLVQYLKLSNEEEVSQFCYFVIELKGLEENINSKNDARIKFFLCNALFEFRNRK